MPAPKRIAKRIVELPDGSRYVHYTDGSIDLIEADAVERQAAAFTPTGSTTRFNPVTTRVNPTNLAIDDPDDWDPPQARRSMGDIITGRREAVRESRTETRVERRGLGCLPTALLMALLSIILIFLVILAFPQLQKLKWGWDIANAPAGACSNPYATDWDGSGDGNYYANGQTAPEGLIWVYLEKNAAGDNVGLGKVVKTLPTHGARIHSWLTIEECGHNVAKDVKGVDQ